MNGTAGNTAKHPRIHLDHDEPLILSIWFNFTDDECVLQINPPYEAMIVYPQGAPSMGFWTIPDGQFQIQGGILRYTLCEHEQNRE